MNYLKKLCLLLLLFSFITLGVQAQADKKSKSDSKESVIILKKGDSKQKFTIEIDGDKLTVNGKPVEDFKSDDLEILRDEDADKFTMRTHGGPVMAMGMGPEGQWDLMGKDFMKEIHSNKAFLGVMTQKTDEGAKITDVTKESAAEKAGLKEGDVITKINDDKIEDAGDLYKAVGKYKPEDKVSITYKRDGKESTTAVVLGENKQVEVFNWNSDGDFNSGIPRRPYKDGFTFAWQSKPRVGLQVQDTEDSKGVKVLDVDDESPAKKAGIKEDDIITQINGKDIASVDDLKNNIKDAKPGDTIKLTFLRNNQTQTVNVKFPKELKTTDL